MFSVAQDQARIACRHGVSCFHLQDAAFYMCHDRINAVTIAPVTSSNSSSKSGAPLDAVLGCQDHCIRVMQEGSGDLVSETPVQVAGGCLL